MNTNTVKQRFRLELEALPSSIPAEKRLARGLKHLLRAHGLPARGRVTTARPGQPGPARERSRNYLTSRSSNSANSMRLKRYWPGAICVAGRLPAPVD